MEYVTPFVYVYKVVNRLIDYAVRPIFDALMCVGDRLWVSPFVGKRCHLINRIL